MFRKIFLFSVANLIVASSVFGQKLFRDGYVVNSNGDTLNGLVQYFEGNRVPQKITFKRFDIATPRVYLPNELMAFGYRNGNHFESKIIDGIHVLLECYVKGEISLYANGKKVYVSKANVGLVDITKDIISTKTGSSYSNHIKFLSAITSSVKDFEVPHDLKLNPDSLSVFFAKYNERSKKPFQIFAQNSSDNNLYSTRKTERTVGIRAGMKMAHVSTRVIETRNTFFDYTAGNNSFCFAAFYTQQVSRLNNNLAVQIELLYSDNSYMVYEKFERKTPVETHYIELISKQSILTIPIGLVYTYPMGKFSPFLHAGISYSFILFSDDQKYLDVLRLNNDIYSYGVDEEKYTRQNDLLRANVELGVKYKITSDLFLLAGINAESIMNFVNLDASPFPISKATDTFKFKYLHSSTVELSRKSPLVTFRVGVGFTF